MFALQYRPRRFEDISGQKASKFVLVKMVQTDRVPFGLLFVGVRGSGKTSAARILAAALNCKSVSVPCGVCVFCKSVFDGNSTDSLEIDAASRGGVSEIRELIDAVQYQGSSKKRVVIIDECHMLSKEAFNALLKTLEEPPPHVVFILVTTLPNKIPVTVLSRLMSFEFSAISVPDISERLLFITKEETIDIELELIHEIAVRAEGGLRDAIISLEKISIAGIKTLDEFNELYDIEDFAPVLISSMCAGKFAEVFHLAQSQLSRTGDPHALSDALVSTLREALVLRAGGALPRQGRYLETRQALAGLLEAHRAFAALRIFWDLRTKTRVNENPKIALDVALVMVTEALSGKIHSEKIVPVVQTVSLEEMNDL